MKDYYTNKFNKLTGSPINRSFRLADDKSKTDWMNINKRSAKELILWLIDNYDQME